MTGQSETALMTREIKVGSRYVPGQASVYSGRKSQIYSSILLSGRWLEDAGFKPGDKVTVSFAENKILVTKGDRIG